MSSPPTRRWLGPLVGAVVLGAGSAVYRRSLPEPRPAPPPAPVAVVPSPPAPKKAPEEPALPFDLVEDGAAAGLRFEHRKYDVPALLENVAPWIASVGVGVAVADVDGDGRPDVYVTNGAQHSRNALFLNLGGGRFREAAAAAGLADVNSRTSSMRPLFFDFEGDGDKDLFLTTNYCPQAFLNDGKGVFSPVPGAAGVDYCGLAFASAAADLDGDGDLDLVLAGYFPPVDFFDPKTTVVMQNSLTAADNGGETLVYRNEGGRFARWPGNLGLKPGYWTQAVAAYDFQDDGLPDLYFATDYNQDRALLNRGGGAFEDVSSALAHKYSRSGMNADVAEPGEDGRPAVYVTHIFEPPFKLGPNTLWTWVGGARRFEERGAASGAGSCGWAWGGKFVDLDLDGWQDLVVTNGYISSDPKRNYWYRMSVLAGAAGDVVADARNWPPMAGHTMSGYQRKCVFRNLGKGRFENVIHETGMSDDLSDGRAVAVIDALGDGRPGLVMGNQGQTLRYYRNVPRHRNAWVGFRLRGTRSNRDGWGARVRVRSGPTTRARQLWPANSFMSQSDDRLLFGLGAWDGPVDVEVRWPSGTVQALEGLPPGRYHELTEPSS